MGDTDGDSEEDMEGIDEDEYDEELLFGTACALCDDGGLLVCCEGRCRRTFHATEEDGAHSDCRSLGLSRPEVEALDRLVCKNCVYNRHQCFACGILGSSDNSDGAEVFPCGNPTCGHFYHAKCVAGLLFENDSTGAAECEREIAAREPFTCPVHKCHACQQGEDRGIRELQFAVCRRCPLSYHRRCLPEQISFEGTDEFLRRAWEVHPGRIWIYCVKHQVEPDLGTPMRNHIVFPESP